MKVYFYGKFRRRHVFPTLSAVDVVQDEPPHDVCERWIQFEWFGLSANFVYPTSSFKKSIFIDARCMIRWLSQVVS